ncbi:MAG TPA: ABC transporter ATP-binding protein [Tepidisphaeraceae bacterium]|jgi:lipopolysaccharide transport system ATP-binding protein
MSSNSDVALRVQNVSKAYRIAHNATRATTLAEALVHRIKRPLQPPTYETFWALQDLSLEIKQGSVAGVIGRNGAGKSTFLKILSRITEPTSGKIELFGRIGSLLEVGTGFHPELTGRENIYLNGQILGMRKREVDRQFDAIVDFAGVEKFLDTPVKRYSSGMYVRLAFAVAAHLSSEILLVDEVLAVGDAEFQKKCLGKMGDVARSGRTVLFVSHNMSAVSTLCTEALVLHKGRTAFHGATQAAIAHYNEAGYNTHGSTWEREPDRKSSALVVQAVTATLKGEQPNHTLAVSVRLESRTAHKPAFMSIDVLDASGAGVAQAIPTLDRFIKDTPRAHDLEVEIDLPALIPGRYMLTLWVGSHNTEMLDFVQEIVAFEIEQSPTPGRTFPHNPMHGYVVPSSRVTVLDADLAVPAIR